MQLQSKNRKKYVLLAHIIFTVKYRKRILNEYEDFIKDSFRKISKTYDFKILEIGIDKDHVHILISYNPNQTISKIVKSLKQVSTYNIWLSFEDKLQKIFYNKRVFWSSGYFVSSVGEFNEDIIFEYIRNQGK